MNRDSNEIERAIEHQLLFIKNSWNLYNEGCREEAIRISGAINLLLESRKSCKGLLRRLNHDFQLLSTTPELQKMDLNRLVIIYSKNISEAEESSKKYYGDIRLNKRFVLAHLNDKNKWHVFTYDIDKKYISCLLDDLICYLPFNEEGAKLPLSSWIQQYSDKNPIMSNKDKEFILKGLGFLLYGDHFLGDTFSPMILHSTNENMHTTSDHLEERYLSIDEWYDEIIFAYLDENNRKHTLTRKLLIETARDKDGGGHFDITLKNDAYYHSKRNRDLNATIGNKTIQIQDAHLIMLHKLGYEILNSPSLSEYIK